MKRCPTCNRTYTDLSLNFCLEDGTPLTTDAPGGPDPNATLRYPSPRDTAEPPPTEIYQPAPSTPAPPPRPAPAPPPPPPPPQQQWSPTPTQAPRKKSNAVWWILGGFAALFVIGVGLVVMLIALASLGSNSNNNNLNANTSNVNRNANVTVNANIPNANASVSPPGVLTDDFSEKKWNVGISQFGRMWYENDEYHMSSKAQMYIVMYAPSEDYSTENATVKVTARSVDGTVPSNGFGLMVHCTRTRTQQLEDYALLIYPSDEPEYEIIMHKDGNQSSLVARTKSDAIQSGSNPNELEIRIKGSELSFYANGKFLTKITDPQNYRRGRAGFYTSDVTNVA
ncbi:MAG TPA: hypothetical protein VJS13_08750, partial [Pyrinomonadaceae bacterium]|nr:hypothetical protein [Pyrinomonadaceae bacterium]